MEDNINNVINELKSFKEEYDFLHKKIGELEWELATLFYGRKAVAKSETDSLHDRLDNYRENMGILVEKVREEVSKINETVKKSL